MVEDYRPGIFDICRVRNATIGDGGLLSPESDPFASVHLGIDYSGPWNPRPFFFLGCVAREDVCAIGGNDEDFIYPGYDDDWFAQCLMFGRKLEPRYRGDILGWHIDHPRPEWVNHIYNESQALLNRKQAAGVFQARSGPWSYVQGQSVNDTINWKP
jgi:hypothetical protein